MFEFSNTGDIFKNHETIYLVLIENIVPDNAIGIKESQS